MTHCIISLSRLKSKDNFHIYYHVQQKIKYFFDFSSLLFFFLGKEPTKSDYTYLMIKYLFALNQLELLICIFIFQISHNFKFYIISLLINFINLQLNMFKYPSSANFVLILTQLNMLDLNQIHI